MSNWNVIKKLYIDNKIKIFPVSPNGKTPLIEDWLNECSCDYMQVLYWYENCPDCNWGVPATPNDLFILDLDVHDIEKNGVDNFRLMLTNIFDIRIDFELEDICDTLMQETPSGGRHIVYRSDEELKNVLNSSNSFPGYPGIDIRTSGYIVVEPSVINDKQYKFINNLDIVHMDNRLKEYILENTTTKSDIKKEPYKKPTSVEIGDRDNQLYSYINNIYYKTRLDYDEILCLALNFNENVLEKPFPEKAVIYKVKKVFEKDRGTMLFINLGE